ncbi:2-amino-4-hydroxy-6-hydroxymethyldihydropteridine diphosphokinase [Sedimenticola sp.]|uniref:2-amino-4-hydroxy-6- hydroxymethyldihydropteridine diphosphokinase n=1 Tax=Sedimenticola sp. TaxID=1940285 RepID=UPI003D0E1813
MPRPDNHPVVTAYIGLGSNLADPVRQVRSAFEALQQIPQTVVRQCSSLYLSSPMGPTDQPDYINAVVALETLLEPHALLTELQAIESAQGRTRGVRWGARTLDLDLLVYGKEMIADEELTVPHPGLPGRAFVLYPLQEIEPNLEIPGMGMLAVLVMHCPKEGLQRYE